MAVDVLPDVSIDVMAIAGDGSVALAWTAPADNGAVIEDYIAEYSADEGLNWQPYDDGVSADPSMTVSNLVNGTSYIFQIAAVNEFQQPGEWSAGSNAVTPAGLPAIPTDIVGVAGDGAIQVTWGVPADNGAEIADYVVDYSTDDGLSWSTFEDGVSAASVADVTGLANGTHYVFRVAAVNPVGQGSWSELSGEAIPMSAPGQPTGLAAVGGNQSATLTWLAPANDGGSAVLDYVVEYRLTTSDVWTAILEQPRATIVTVGGLTNGVTYLFRVAARTAFAAGEFTSTPQAATPLPPPTRLVGSASAAGAASGTVSLSWAAPVTPATLPVLDYVVQFSSDGGSTWQLHNDAESSARSTIVGALANGTTYLFRVAAVTVAGQGVFSAPSAPLTPFLRSAAALPAKPTAVMAVGSNGTVALSWTPPSRNAGGPPIDYVVRVRFDRPGAKWFTVSRPASADPTAFVKRLVPGRAFLFQVAARNLSGVGAFSDPISVRA